MRDQLPAIDQRKHLIGHADNHICTERGRVGYEPTRAYEHEQE
jgi:hypothetical protein